MNKVLIIEDSVSAAALLGRGIAARTGLEYEIAGSLQKTRDILERRAEDFFLALCDLNLPDCPMGESVDLVLEYKLAAVVVTSMCDKETRALMRSKDIADYIVKQSEADLQYLFRLVKRIHNNRHLSAMVVDDSRAYREKMRNLLLRQRIRTYAVATGEEALKILVADPQIKLILTDYIMPDMDGLELIRAIRKEHDPDRVAIIGTSASDHNTLAHTFLKSGANDFMSKLASMEELVCRINMNLDMVELLDQAARAGDVDQTTGLANKRYLYREGGEALERWRRKDFPPHLALIRIDRFNAVTQDHGWFAGDAVLRRVADVLREIVTGPAILARLGEETFCVLNLSPVPVDSKALFSEIQQTIERRPAVYEGEEIGVTASVAVNTGRGSEHDLASRLGRTRDILEILRAHGLSGFRMD